MTLHQPQRPTQVLLPAAIHLVVAVSHPTSWDTIRRVIAVEYRPVGGRPHPGCHALVPVRVAGRRILFVACGRRLPKDQQCPGCRTTITTRTISTTHTTGPSTGGVVSSRSR